MTVSRDESTTIFGYTSTAAPVSEYVAACAIGAKTSPTTAAAPSRLACLLVSIVFLLLSVPSGRSRSYRNDDIRLEADLVVHALITEVARSAAARGSNVGTGRAGRPALADRT